jgi:hypothetical protein
MDPDAPTLAWRTSLNQHAIASVSTPCSRRQDEGSFAYTLPFVPFDQNEGDQEPSDHQIAEPAQSRQLLRAPARCHVRSISPGVQNAKDQMMEPDSMRILQKSTQVVQVSECLQAHRQSNYMLADQHFTARPK